MNWRTWVAIIVSLLIIGIIVSLVDWRSKNGDLVKDITFISVDLLSPYSGRVTVSYLNGASPDNFQVVVGAREDAHEFLDQYFIPYEDPERVQVTREGYIPSVSFPIKPVGGREVNIKPALFKFKSDWRPFMETLRFEIKLPATYDLVNATSEGLTSPLTSEHEDRRWVLRGQAKTGWPVQLEAIYVTSGATVK